MIHVRLSFSAPLPQILFVCLFAIVLSGCASSKEPQLRAFGDQSYWVLTEDFVYQFPDSKVEIRVPKGFVTDFASIPEPFRPVFSEKSAKSDAAIIHDYLYWDQSCGRGQADQIMQLAMKDAGVSSVEVLLIYGALKFGGRSGWKTNERLRREGRPRIVPKEFLKEMPADASWSEFRAFLRREGVKPSRQEKDDGTPEYCVMGD